MGKRAKKEKEGGRKKGKEREERKGLKTTERCIHYRPESWLCLQKSTGDIIYPSSHLLNFEHSIKNRVLWLFSDELNKKIHCFLAQWSLNNLGECIDNVEKQQVSLKSVFYRIIIYFKLDDRSSSSVLF